MREAFVHVLHMSIGRPAVGVAQRGEMGRFRCLASRRSVGQPGHHDRRGCGLDWRRVLLAVRCQFRYQRDDALGCEDLKITTSLGTTQSWPCWPSRRTRELATLRQLDLAESRGHGAGARWFLRVQSEGRSSLKLGELEGQWPYFRSVSRDLPRLRIRRRRRRPRPASGPRLHRRSRPRPRHGHPGRGAHRSRLSRRHARWEPAHRTLHFGTNPA